MRPMATEHNEGGSPKVAAFNVTHTHRTHNTHRTQCVCVCVLKAMDFEGSNVYQ